MRKLLLILAPAVLLIGCDGDDPAAAGFNCSFKDAGGPSGGMCMYYGVETSPAAVDQARQSCTTGGGVSGDTPAPRRTRSAPACSSPGQPGR